VGSGDLQGPRIYTVRPAFVRQGESREAATLRWAAAMTDASIASAGGDPRTFAPWIFMNRFDRRPEYPLVTAEFTEAMLKMLRDKGVQEVILWSDDTTQNSHRPWNELVQIADRLWPRRRR
jgi:hypothetical protein